MLQPVSDPQKFRHTCGSVCKLDIIVFPKARQVRCCFCGYFNPNKGNYMPKKHPSKSVIHKAAVNFRKKGQPKLEKTFEGSIISSAGNKKPKKRR